MTQQYDQHLSQHDNTDLSSKNGKFTLWESIAAFLIPKSQNGWIGLGIVIAGLFAAGYFLNAWDNKKEGEVTPHLIGQYVQKSKELVSMKWHYRNAAEYKGKDGWIRNGKKIIVVYEGKILIGVDLGEAQINVDNNAKSITLILPKAQVLAHEIYESKSKFYDIDQGSFLPERGFDYSTFFKEFGTKNKRQIEREVARNEIMQEAEKSAAETLVSILTMNDQIEKDYEIVINEKVVKAGVNTGISSNNTIEKNKTQESK